MTRTDALLKLLALGAMTRDEIVRCTGWPASETDAALEELLARDELGKHRFLSGNGPLLYFIGQDTAGRRLPRGASGRAVSNARRSTFFATNHQERR